MVKFVNKNAFIVRCNYKKAYPVIVSLKKAGFRVFAGVNNDCGILWSEAFSRYVDCVVRVADPEVSERMYIASIVRAVKRYDIDIVVPIGFIDFMLLSKYRDIVEKHSVVPVESYDKMQAVSNKWFLRKIADSISINYPKSILLRGYKDRQALSSFLGEVLFPLVVKGIGDASKPVFVCSYNELLKHVRDRKWCNVLIQEFIPGIGAGYFALSYNGNILAEFMHRRLFELTPLGGASVKACSHFDYKLLELGRNIIKSIKWTGVVMIEFRKDLETGKYYLLEINPKFWGSLELAYRAGVDFPKYLVEFFLEGKKPKKNTVKDVCFSWLSSAFSSYSRYGLKTLKDIASRVLHRNLLLTDLHLTDPLNFAFKIVSIALSFSHSLLAKEHLLNIYVTNELKESVNRLGGMIFDFDGTLVNLNVPWNIVAKNLLTLGLIDRNESIMEAFYNYWVNNDRYSFDKMNRIVKRYEMKAVNKLVPDNRLINAFEELKERAVKLAVVSKQSRDVVAEGLRRIGVIGYVDCILGREDEMLRVEQLCKVKDKMFEDFHNIQCIVMGDTLVDVKAALQSHMVPFIIAVDDFRKLQAKELGISYSSSVVDALRIIAKISGFKR